MSNYKTSLKLLFLALHFFAAKTQVTDNEKPLTQRMIDNCYEFTWKSDIESGINGNSTTQCGMAETIPCHPPMIPGKNPPTKEDIANFTVGNTNPDYICQRAVGESCMKYTLYTKDDAETSIYITRFCGRAIDDTDNVIVDSGCHTMENFSPGVNAEICICGDRFCNTASSQILLHNYLIYVTLFLAVLARA